MATVLIVGAGFAGGVAARALADKGQKVLVVDRRKHVAGNAYDLRDAAGITLQVHGPHIFHTNEKRVWDFLSRFTSWHYYQHRVLGYVNGQCVPIPINIDTVNQLYGLSLDADTIGQFYAARRVAMEKPASLREAVVAGVGEELYDLVFKNYTLKQWGIDGDRLPAAIAGRVLARTNRDPRYFTDRYQGMPAHGYTALFAAMLDHPNIKTRLDCEYADLPAKERRLPTLHSGGIDEYFAYRHGPLPYRSLRFEFKTHDREWYQPAAVVNYPNDYDFTRITEFKHWTGEKSAQTTTIAEYPAGEGEPYYPMPTEEAQNLYRRYAAEAGQTPGSPRFIGRLGTYRYMNMDQVALESLLLADSWRE